jgi:hypothetical protein
MSRHDDPTDLPDVTFPGVAADLGIPPERLTEPAVRQLVGLMARVLQLQLDFSEASTNALNIAPPVPPAAGTQSFVVRYYVADNLLRVIAAVLREGMAAWERPLTEDPGYLLEKTRKALARYELTVKPNRPAVPRRKTSAA